MSDALPSTYLFVPGDRPERFAKAIAAGADAVIVDLEDAVAPANKQAAVQVDGRMVDRPVMLKAQDILRRAR